MRLKRDKNFIDTINILNNSLKNYWVCHGTLLGIIRDRKLIPWDTDIDIGVWKNDFKKNLLIEKFKKKGFQTKIKFYRDENIITFIRYGGREIDINIYETTKNNKFAFQRHFALKNFFSRIIYVLSYEKKYRGKYNKIVNLLRILKPFFLKLKKSMIQNKVFYKEAGFKTPKYIFLKTKKIRFENLIISIPIFYKNYFELIYGKNWKKPLKSYNWEKNPNASNIIK